MSSVNGMFRIKIPVSLQYFDRLMIDWGQDGLPVEQALYGNDKIEWDVKGSASLLSAHADSDGLNTHIYLSLGGSHEDYESGKNTWNELKKRMGLMVSEIVQEQRKRREFLYHVYDASRYTKWAEATGYAAIILLSQAMAHNWEPFQVYDLNHLLFYHLENGNISATRSVPSPDEMRKLLASPMWRHPHNRSCHLDKVYITAKGLQAVENDQELLDCASSEGVVNWLQLDLPKSIFGKVDATSVTAGKKTDAISGVVVGIRRQGKRKRRWEKILKDYIPNGLTQAVMAEREDVSLETIKADIRDMKKDGVISK
jgi:hypothetical protein